MLAALFLLSCQPAPPVQTSTGIMVPAATVVAQDTVADVLKLWKDAHNKAVAIHDSLAPTEDPVVHAAHRKVLLGSATGLHAAYQALQAWKASSTAAPPVEIIAPVMGSLRAFLDLAVQLDAITSADAAKIRGFLQ